MGRRSRQGTSRVLADVVDRLRCPHCAARADTEVGLALDGRSLRCPRGHTFDVAKQGYASLLTGHAPPLPGDTAAMVAARESFLAGGHFAAITQALAEAAVAASRAATRGAPPGPSGPATRGASPGPSGPATRGTTPGAGGPGGVVDLGAGTGHHLAAVLDALPGHTGVAADISGYALHRAARAHPRAGAIRCDAWRPLPLRTGAASVVLNVFAPRNGAELHRVLQPGGAVLVVAPTGRHLRELATAVGAVSVDPRKADRLDAALGPYFARAADQAVETTVRLSHADALTAVAMGPAAWHVEPEALAERIGTLPDPVEVTVSVTLSTYGRTS